MGVSSAGTKERVYRSAANLWAFALEWAEKIRKGEELGDKQEQKQANQV